MLTKKTVSIYTCTLCQEEQEQNAEVISLQIKTPQGVFHYDACGTCMDDTLAPVLRLGESRARGLNGKVSAKLEKASSKRAPATKKPANKAAKGKELKCPDCDYTHWRAAVLGGHRRREHGYVSPKHSV